MDGLFLEQGPLKIDKDGNVTIKQLSWWNDATMVFIDQPVGTGYSLPGEDGNGWAKTMDDIVAGFRAFLDRFQKVWPETSKYDVS
jgi:carboxypeptidase D